MYSTVKKLSRTATLCSILAMTSSCAIPGVIWHAVHEEESSRKNIHGYMLDVNKYTNIQAYDLNNDGTIDEALIVTDVDKESVMEHLVAPDADTTKRAWLTMHYTREMTLEERKQLTEFYKLPRAKAISE